MIRYNSLLQVLKRRVILELEALNQYTYCRRFSKPLIHQQQVASSQLALVLPYNGRRLGGISYHVLPSSGRSFSTLNEPSFSPLDWWRGRQERKEAEKYKKRISEMAETDVWTIGQMLMELEEAVKSWTAKLIDNKETAVVKQMYKALSGIVAVVGNDADAERLVKMTRKEKLEAAVAGETTLEEINILNKQFQTMSLMHQVLRKRKLEGKPIPETAEAMQQLIQVEGPKLLTKDQKQKMAKTQARMLTRRR